MPGKRGLPVKGGGNWIALKAVEARRAKSRGAQASASEVGATDLPDGTRGAVDVGRSGASGVKLRAVDDSVEAPTMTSVRRSSRLRDRSRSQRRARLVSQGKGMFAGVVRNAKQKNFCSYKNIGEKAGVVGYFVWRLHDCLWSIVPTGHRKHWAYRNDSIVKKA